MIDQITWNILFEWITGTRCFLPEGCKPPFIGVLVYLMLLAPLIWFLFSKYGSSAMRFFGILRRLSDE